MSRRSRDLTRFALVEREADEEDESSSGSEETEDEGDQEELTRQPSRRMSGSGSLPSPNPQAAAAGSRKPLKIPLNKDLACHVCGQKGHKAGFVGATYYDCPNKPCYLCKQPGHTTATCPHRAMPGKPGAPTAGAAGASRGSSRDLTQLLAQREQAGGGLSRHLPAKSPPWEVSAAILKLHTRRCCCLEFPTDSDSVVISGDKKGQVALWNFDEVHERTIFKDIHFALVNTIKPAPWAGSNLCASASSDGTVKLFDMLTGSYKTLVDLNPGGWFQGCKWNMSYGCDANEELRVIMAGDSDGKVWVCDPRSATPVGKLQLHKVGCKVNSVSVNPGAATMVLTGGNDHTAKLFDVRKLTSSLGATAAAAATGGGSTTAAAAAVAPAVGSPITATAAAAVETAGLNRRPSRQGGAATTAAAAAVTAGADDDADEDGDDDAFEPARGRGGGRGRGRGTASRRSSSSGAAEQSQGSGGGTRGRGRGRGTRSAAAASPAGGGGPSPAAPTGRGSGSGRGRGGGGGGRQKVELGAPEAVVSVLQHPRVVNAAYFSPLGHKILTTCQDNRLRMWDYGMRAAGLPDHEIVHSHDFNRYLTPFKAEWDPKDLTERLIVIGRYISEDWGGVALHPVDIMDAQTGVLLQQLTDTNLTTICPVNKPHPRRDIIISGSSRSLYMWTPVPEDELDVAGAAAEAVAGSSSTTSAAAAATAALMRRAAGLGAGSNSRFRSFDADPGDGKKKTSGGKRSSGGTDTKAAKGKKRRGKGPADDEEEDSD